MKLLIGKLKNDKGQTLIETMLYVILFSIIITFLTMILLNFYKAQQDVATITENDDDARIALNTMFRSVIEGYDTLTPDTDLNPITSQLVVQTDSTGDTITYFVNNGQLFSQINLLTAVALTSTNTNISNLTISRQYLSGKIPAVLIQITFSSPANLVNTVTTLQTLATQRKN